MQNILSGNSVIEASVELIPFISIAAFNKSNFCPVIQDSTPLADKYLTERFGKKFVICPKGRDAFAVALKELGLQPSDVVTILTTTGNSYISGCVTKTIETICKWSREFTSETKAIFVNHEFGYAYEGLEELRKYGLPIIEDCAHSFFTKSDTIGKVGDFVIYSLPKAFSLQLGSILVYKDQVDYAQRPEIVTYVKSALEAQVEHIEVIIAKRFANYNYYIEKLSDIGVSPYFKLKEGDVPGVFMFKFDRQIDYRALKTFLNENGIDSSVFFGQDAYFVPVHHNMSRCEQDYIINLIKYFYENEVQ